MTIPATIRIKPAGGAWITCGTEDQSGYVPEGISASSTDAGSDTISFNLRRDPRLPFPDLQPFSPCELEVAGVKVWSGYVWQTPAAGDYTIGVAGRGWQYHLDDDQNPYFFVHANLADWIDVRTGWSMPTADLSVYTAIWGTPPVTWPTGLAIASGKATGIIFDSGLAGAIKRIVVKLSNNVWTGPATAPLLVADVSNTLPVTRSSAATLVADLRVANTSQFKSATFTTAGRYCLIWVSQPGGTPTADNYVRFESIQSFGSTAWESGNASILKASDIIKTVLPLAPLINQSTTYIQTTSFSIPQLFVGASAQTARQYMDAANAFHNWLLQVDVDRNLVFRPRPSVPLIEVSAAGGATFQDAALNNGEDVYNWVNVPAVGLDGGAFMEVRNLASPLLTAQGRARTFTLNTSAALTPAAADAIGDAWLLTRAKNPLKGSLEVTGTGGVRTMLDGSPVHPSLLLRMGGELVRLNDRVNPDTGGWGRHGTIASVSYSHDGEKASLSIDSPRDRLETLLARLGVVETAVGQ